jgi:hypothetical protein
LSSFRLTPRPQENGYETPRKSLNLHIFKSTDLTGVQWKALGGRLPTSGFGRIALAFGRRRGLGFSQPLPLVYPGFDANGTYRLFVTKDGGDSWSELPSPPSDGQLGFNNVITVGPQFG